MALCESGHTDDVNSRNKASLGGIADGERLTSLIHRADQHAPIDGWTVCPDDERADP